MRKTEKYEILYKIAYYIRNDKIVECCGCMVIENDEDIYRNICKDKSISFGIYSRIKFEPSILCPEYKKKKKMYLDDIDRLVLRFIRPYSTIIEPVGIESREKIRFKEIKNYTINEIRRIMRCVYTCFIEK